MMISPETYQEFELKGKTINELEAEEACLKASIEELKVLSQSKNAVIAPSPSLRLSMTREYLSVLQDELRKAYAENIHTIDGDGYKIIIDGNSVTAFSKKRIPFELGNASDGIKAFKNQLRASISRLDSSENTILFARYGTDDDSMRFYDLENILFYNIGSAPFKAATQHGLRFGELNKSDIVEKRNTYSVLTDYKHIYEYRIIDKCDCSFSARKNDILVRWKDIRSFAFSGTRKPADYWRLIKDSSDKTELLKTKTAEYFGLSITVSVPLCKKFFPASAMKSMLDGIISAFHSAKDMDEYIDSLTAKLNCSENELRNSDFGVLGQRRYIYPNSLIWNPADDKCKSVTLLIKESTTDDWLLSGEFFEIND